MNFYKFNLFLTSVLIIVIYFTAFPFYNRWLKTKAVSPNNNMFDQMQNLDPEYRKEYRFGPSYSVYRDIGHTLSSEKNVTVLLPTTAYMRAVNINYVDIPEPAVFYYFTGIKSVWANSPNVRTANWTLLASKKMGMRMMDIKSNTQLDSLIFLYKPYIK